MVIRELKNNGVYFLNLEEKVKMEKVILLILKKFNLNIVG